MIETLFISAGSHKAGFQRTRWATAIGLAAIAAILLASPAAADVNEGEILLWYAAPHNFLSLPQEAAQVAKNVVTQVLPQLVGNDEKFSTRLGFQSASEVTPQSLSVDPPFAVFRVSLTRVKDFVSTPHSVFFLLNEEANWHRALGVSPVRFLFPIKANNVLKSSVIVSQDINTNKWDIQQLGSSNLIKRLTLHGSSSKHFVVWVPALNRHYLGRFEGGQLRITVVFPDALGYHEGQQLDATVVFKQLGGTEALTMTDAPR